MKRIITWFRLIFARTVYGVDCGENGDYTVIVKAKILDERLYIIKTTVIK